MAWLVTDMLNALCRDIQTVKMKRPCPRCLFLNKFARQNLLRGPCSGSNEVRAAYQVSFACLVAVICLVSLVLHCLLLLLVYSVFSAACKHYVDIGIEPMCLVCLQSVVQRFCVSHLLSHPSRQKLPAEMSKLHAVAKTSTSMRSA